MNNRSNKIIGYTTGVFDLFHIGHLNILKKAKSYCNYLIVGILTDELASQIKNKRPAIPFSERVEIIKSIMYVDKVVAQDHIDEVADYHKYHFNVIFKGSDWKGTEKWMRLEKEFNALGVKVIFFPYTNTTSSTLIRDYLLTHNNDKKVHL